MDVETGRVIADTHCHVGPSKYEPVESLLFQMDQAGVDHAIVTQHNGMYDNEYVLDRMERHPRRLSLVAQIDPAASHPADEVDRLVERGASGVRIPFDSPVSTVDYEPLWERLNTHRLPLSLNGTPHDFVSDRCEALLAACDSTPVVFEHLFGIGDVPSPCGAYESSFQACLNTFDRDTVYCKIPGPGEVFALPDRLTRELRYTAMTDHFERVFDTIPTSRLMWGSDFPLCSGREGYENTLRGLRQVASTDDEELDDLFGGTAARVFGVDR